MATNKRDATRRQLERQLAERQQREARRKQVVLFSSIGGTLVVIAAVVALVIHFGSGSSSSPSKGGNVAAGGSTKSASPTPSPSTSASTTSGAPCTPVTKTAGAVVFDGVSVGNATNLKVEPKVRSCSDATPKGLEYKDLVVGKGKAATPTSSVKVQYTGVLYKNGTEFDSSWARGQAATFSLTGVVPGFTQGIGGKGSSIPAMRVGGRRIMILPASLGYGSTATGSIPANSTLVFVVDLLSSK